MAREIHDQLGQSLTALKLDLAATRARLPGDDPELERRVRQMDGLLDETLDTARRLSTALRPPLLDDVGFVPALECLASEFQARSRIECRTSLPADLPIPSAEAMVLFRIVQEALTNVARHAGARHVRIALSGVDGALVLTVADDGRGISAEERARPAALGLLGMRERALVLGGEVTIVGRPAEGTTVTVRLPRPATAAASG
jgi:signal transduction histidine kinase